MPNVYKQLRETMQKHQIPQETIEQIYRDAETGAENSYLTVIAKMDALLTREQCLALMERQGCCKCGKRDTDCRAFAKENADKPLAEKLALMAGIEHMMAPRLNSDGTFTITMSGHQNGVHTGKTTCSCGAIKKIKQPFSISPTYCGCCAGHFLYHYQNALKVKLRLKAINSSPLNTNGKKPCSFTFEIVGENMP